MENFVKEKDPSFCELELKKDIRNYNGVYLKKVENSLNLDLSIKKQDWDISKARRPKL